MVRVWERRHVHRATKKRFDGVCMTRPFVRAWFEVLGLQCPRNNELRENPHGCPPDFRTVIKGAIEWNGHGPSATKA